MARTRPQLSAHDENLIETHTRLIELPGETHIEVRQGARSRPRPYDTDWRVLRKLPPGASEEEIVAARRAVLRFGRFFPVCKTCGRRMHADDMGKDKICLPCGGVTA